MPKRLLMIIAVASIVAAVLLSTLSVAKAQEGMPQTATSQPASASAPADPMTDIKFDLKKKQIVISAKVALTTGPVEFLLCRTGTKDYESVLSSGAMPSSVHGLLLAMGLTPGKPARTIYPDGEQPKFLPPRGPELKITVRWKDDKGKAKEVDAGDLLAPQQAGPKDKKPLMPKSWVFVGSDTLPDGQYWADKDGDIVSVANFGSSTIDVPFESSNKNEILSYKANSDTVPAKGTAVEVVIQVAPGAENEPHARIAVEVDRFGRFSVEGKTLTEEELTDWASKFSHEHSKTEVNLRLDERSLAGDITRAQDALKLGGIWDVSQQIISRGVPLPPRSPEQAKESLEQWARRFDSTRDVLEGPIQDAQELLKAMRVQMTETDAMQAMWKEYTRQIQQGLDKYKASATKPAEKNQ